MPQSGSVPLMSLRLLSLGVILYTLEAYTIGSIPLSWISNLAIILSACVLLSGRRIRVPAWPVALISLYLGVSLFALVWYNVSECTPAMPPRATSSYPVFIALRVFAILAFISAMISGYFTVVANYYTKLLTLQRWVLVFVFISALYIYFAQIHGMWEPLRNRMGTGGQDFSTEPMEFSYIFHRATGTFREPSHMAEFVSATMLLILPALTYHKTYKTARFKVIFVVAFILVFILSGSLLGLIAFVAGFSIYMMSGGKRLFGMFSRLICLFLFVLVAASTILDVNYFGAIEPRVQDIFSGGILSTNRNYVYVLAQTLDFRFIGYGLGNPALLFSSLAGSELAVPVLNLFLNIFLESGILGLGAILIVFFAPLLYFVRFTHRDPTLVAALAAHVSWIVAGIGRIPELNTMHGVVLGILFGLIYVQKCEWARRITGRET